MSTKYFIMSKVSMPHEDIIMPNWAPLDEGQSFEEVYQSFAFDEASEANDEATDEEEELTEAVSRGDIPDFDPIEVKKGELQEDGSISFEDGTTLTASAIYSHFGREIPDFSPVPSV